MSMLYSYIENQGMWYKEF